MSAAQIRKLLYRNAFRLVYLHGNRQSSQRKERDSVAVTLVLFGSKISVKQGHADRSCITGEIKVVNDTIGPLHNFVPPFIFADVILAAVPTVGFARSGKEGVRINCTFLLQHD